MRLSGVVGYVLTPFDNKGEVDHSLLALQIKRLINQGVHGVAPLGSVGCLQYLSDDERDAVVDTAVAASAGEVPVLVGVSSLSTAHTIRHAVRAEKAGASAVQVLPSTYWKLTEVEIYHYFSAVADAISIPVMVYNNPFTTGLDMSVELLSKLTTIPNIKFIKESSPDKTKIARLRDAVSDEVGIFVGLNPMAKQGLLDGAIGWCTAAPNVCASLNLNLFRCAHAGDAIGASAWFSTQEKLLNFLMDHGLPRTVAAGLELCGVSAGHLRAPLSALTPALQHELENILKDLEII